MTRTLVAGFGNLYRRDDGVARFIVNDLRTQLGRPELDEMDDGFEDLGFDIDTVVLHQLVPEMAETVKDYDLVIFVDAHVPNSMSEDVHEEVLQVNYKTPFVFHQTHPSSILALSKQMYGIAPKAMLLSVVGYDYDFGPGLSDATAALVPQAVGRILEMAQEA